MRCTVCGAELYPQDRFCRSCGAPGAQLPPQFAEAQARFAEVQAQYRAGQISDAAYEQALRALVVQDAGGYWMLGADSGAWYWHDGGRWVPRDPVSSGAVATAPPRTVGAAGPAQAVPVREARRAPRRRWLWVAIAVLLLCVAAGAALLWTTPYGAVVRHSVAIAVDPQDPGQYRARAAAYGELEAHARAAADDTRAIELDPGATYPYLMRAIHYDALDRTEDAIADLGVVVLLDPENCLAYRMRGDLWRRQADIRRAQADYERVLAFGEGGVCYEDALQGLAAMGLEPGAPAQGTAPALGATPAAQESATPEMQTATPSPQAREMLFHDDFEGAHDPAVGDVGEVRWEGGELQILVSQAGKDVTALYREASGADYRVHVTVRPVRVQPGSMYGVQVRTDPERAVVGGYWFRMRGDGACQACIEQGDGSLTCPSDWQSCPLESMGGNWVVVEAIGSTLTFWLNETLVATFQDSTYASGAVALWVGNDEATTETVVAFDDLALFEP